jgi:hypothetical protein
MNKRELKRLRKSIWTGAIQEVTEALKAEEIKNVPDAYWNSLLGYSGAEERRECDYVAALARSALISAEKRDRKERP